jgi:hypothetical protein
MDEKSSIIITKNKGFKDMKKFPVKVIRAETLIPKGSYCYSDMQVTQNENAPPKFHSKICPFWGLESEQVGICSYIHLKDGDEKGTFLLFDQIKECTINWAEDEFGEVHF